MENIQKIVGAELEHMSSEDLEYFKRHNITPCLYRCNPQNGIEEEICYVVYREGDVSIYFDGIEGEFGIAKIDSCGHLDCLGTWGTVVGCIRAIRRGQLG